MRRRPRRSERVFKLGERGGGIVVVGRWGLKLWLDLRWLR